MLLLLRTWLLRLRFGTGLTARHRDHLFHLVVVGDLMEGENIRLLERTEIIPVDLSWSTKARRIYSDSDAGLPDDELFCSEVWEDLAFAACS